MPAVTASVTLRIPADVLERVDAARGDMSRNLWMVTALRMVVDSPAGGGAWFAKGAVEQALGGTASRSDVPESSLSEDPHTGSNLPPAPAEQPEVPPPDPDRRRPLAPREFRPYPKGGKR